MTGLQTFSAHLPGNDGYYHLKMALLLPELGYVRDFPWLRWTIFHDQFVSHHHGFHTLLAPFALLSQSFTGDAVLGGKLAAAVAMAATFGLLHMTLRYLGAHPTLIWLLLLCAAPWHFWLRMSYVRAPMAALPLLVLAVLWCLRGRTLAVGILAFLFTQIYGGAILFPLIPFAFLAAQILTYSNAGEGPWAPADSPRTSSRPTPALRLAIWQCIAACLGVGLGMVLNPYFPANLQFMYTQVFETGLGAPEGVGSEWKTFDGWNLLVQSVPLGLVWLWCLTRRLQAAIPATSGEIALLLLNVLFLVLTLKARRFVEYWPVFAMLNAASLYAVSRLGVCKEKRTADQPSGVAANPDDFRSSGHQSPTPSRRSADAGGGAPISSPLAKGGTRGVGPGGEPLANSPAMASKTTRNKPIENLPRNAGSLAAWQGRLVLAVLALAAAINLWVTRFELNVSHDVPAIREAMDFMRANSEPGSLILTDDWDSFPTCFYFNHHNTFAVGLDPEFTRTRYPALWERYRRITRAELPARVPSELLQLEMEKNGSADPGPIDASSSSDDSQPGLSGSASPQRNAPASPSEPACTGPKIEYQDIATCFHADYVLVADDHRKLYKALMKEPEHFTPIYPPGTTADSPQAPITIFAAHTAN